MRQFLNIVLCLIVCCGLMPIGPGTVPSALGASALPQETIIPLELANPLDITKLTLDQYRRVAGAAREAMKLVEGDMTGDEAKAFQQKWAVMADFPTPQAINYLNKLNPLLVEFLKLRGLTYTAAEEYDAAWAEGTLAAGYENAPGAEEAFAIAGQQKTLFQSIQARLSFVTKQIEALGDPPDQAEAKMKAGKKHADALKTVKKIIKPSSTKPDGKTLPPAKRSGVIQITSSSLVAEGGTFIEFTADVPPDIAKKATLYYWQSWGGNIGKDISANYTTSPRITMFYPHAPGGWTETGMPTPMAMVNLEAHQVKGKIIAYGTSGRIYLPIRNLNIQAVKTPEPFSGGVYADKWNGSRPSFSMTANLPTEYPRKDVDRANGPRIDDFSRLSIGIVTLNAKDMEYKIRDISNMWKPENREWYFVTQQKISVDMGTFSGEIIESTRRSAKTQNSEGSEWLTFGKGLLTLKKKVPSVYTGSLDYVWIEYEVKSTCAKCISKRYGDYTGLSDKRAQDYLRKIIATINAVKIDYDADQGPAPEADEDVEKIDPETVKETIAFHDSNIAILEKNLQREEEELSRTKDNNRREALEFRVRTVKADIQAEKDLIESLKTGQIVHTRTEFDDYTRNQFISNIRANQIRMEVAQRQAAEAHRIAALLPPGEAEEARKFIDRQLTPEIIAKADLSRIQGVNNALITKVQGYVQQAQAQKEIASAERTLMVLGGLQTAGNIAITFVGGQTGAAAYAGFTGYITGGPAEAIRGAASWYNPVTYMAVEAYDGYTKGGYFAGKGMAGAAEKAASALVMGKLFEYGIQKIGITTGMLSKPATREELQQRLAAFKKSEALQNRLQDFRQAEALKQGLPPFDTAGFKKDMARGKELVDEFTHIEQRLSAAKQFSAAPETVKELEALTAQKAKELNASFHAKNFLKATGGEVEKLATTRIEQLYKQVDARFKKIMTEEKWDMRYLKFKEFRNASSRGKIGMDRDFGLVEDEVTLLIKNGRSSSIHQMQKDGQKAYKQAYEEIMSQNYEKSFQEFTTHAHSESFRDLGVLKDLRNPTNVAQLERMWGEQTARTIEYKGLHMLNDPKLNQHMSLLDRHIESSRGLSKELEKKIIPFLQNAKAAPGIDLKKIKATEEHFRGLKQILDDFSTNKIDPVTASDRLRAYTGGKDLPQVLDQVRNVTEALFKFGAVGK
ncbi:MAG: hypothetical protein NTZ57_09670 [Deltaproteobacteria bacterium]|nr:hypothetical protein [Deltaproteobacteria bacterium]